MYSHYLYCYDTALSSIKKHTLMVEPCSIDNNYISKQSECVTNGNIAMLAISFKPKMALLFGSLVE